jgi:hypothetical protein
MNSILYVSRSRLLAVAMPFLLAALGGCGGPYANLGRVSGKVTLAGQPLADAIVTFSPAGPGSPSTARTDSSGSYTLMFTRGVKGAVVGDHNVTISTHRDADTDGDPPTAEVPEKVPFKYRKPGELKATVKKGSNMIDFPLEAGPIEEPKPEKGKAKKK